MRTTKELLEIMLKNNYKLKIGLCGLAWQLADEGIVNWEEHLHMLNYIVDNRPINFNYFCVYYWKPRKLKPRIKWLKKHIKKNT